MDWGVTRIAGYSRIEALYRRFAGLDLDKGRAERILEIAEAKLRDLFEAAAEKAMMEGRDVIYLRDLPITKGLRETMRMYEEERRRLNDPRLDVAPIIEYIEPALRGLALGEDVREELPTIAATILLLIGYIIKRVDPKAKKPSKEDVEKAKAILDLTL